MAKAMLGYVFVLLEQRARCWAVLPCQKKLPSNRNVFKCSMMYTCMRFLYICITLFLEVLYWQQQNPFLTPTWQPVFCIANQNTSNKVLFLKNAELFQASNHKEAGIPCWAKEHLGKSFSPGLYLLPSPNILLAVVHLESSWSICAGLFCFPLPSLLLLLPQPIHSFFSPLLPMTTWGVCQAPHEPITPGTNRLWRWKMTIARLQPKFCSSDSLQTQCTLFATSLLSGSDPAGQAGEPCSVCCCLAAWCCLVWH